MPDMQTTRQYENIQELQNILNAIIEVGKVYGLNINVSKAKLMVVNRQSHGNIYLHIDDPIERINKFKYIISTTTSDEEVKVRIAMVRIAFAGFDKYLLRRSVLES